MIVAPEMRPALLDPAVLTRYPALAAFARQVGGTELIEVETPRGHGRIFAKCEWQNPHGSIKDRVALAMICAALSKGVDPTTDTVIEYSGGQLAVALAHLCAAVGIRAVIVLSDGTAASFIKSIEAMGAEVILVPKERGFWGVMTEAMNLHRQHPGWHFLYQHTNQANLAIHAETTAKELARQLPVGRLDAWVAAIGTGGTLVGVYQALKRVYPGLRAYGVTPTEMPYSTELAPHSAPKFAGSGGLGCGRKQSFVAAVETEIRGHFHYSYDEALQEMDRFFLATGIRIGSSAAACLLAARALAANGGADQVVATAFASAGVAEEWYAVEQKSLSHGQSGTAAEASDLAQQFNR